MSNYWSGIALPWGLTIPSVIEPKNDYEVIKSSVLWIVLTEIGSRCMRPTFGCNLSRLLFEPNDLDTLNAVKETVKDAVAQWDDRVDVVDFTAQKQGNLLKCAVSYKFRMDPLHNDIQVAEFTLSEDMLA